MNLIPPRRWPQTADAARAADADAWQGRWDAAWNSLSAAPPPGLLEALLRAYAEPWRHYHTQQHLRECLDCLDNCRPLCERPAEVELALWFHDAVYEPTAKDNEARSAAWAVAELSRASVCQDAIARISDLVLITDHRRPPQTPDQSLIIDIDLAIFGASAKRFDDYDRQVREEYRQVAEADFRLARLKLLDAWLASPMLYQTAWFQERMEAAARENLQRSAKSLKESLSQAGAAG
jgi:predicted metal-dependent HD superfamily phosphohydrolase